MYIDPWSEVIDDVPYDANVVFVTHDNPDAIETVAKPSATVVAYEVSTPAAWLERRTVPLERNRHGFVMAFVDTTVYFTTDTNAIEELPGIEANVLLPPIDGTYTMGRHEAAGLVREIDSSLVLSVHYDTDGIESIDGEPEYSRPVEYESNGSEWCPVVSRALLRR